MVNVTELDFYMDNFLQQNLDFCIERAEKNWDNLLIIDGDEGSGKTTLSWGIGKYWAWKLNKSFSLDNIFFNPEELMKKVVSSQSEVLIWDESAIEGLSTDSRNQIQRMLVKILMTSRSKNHYLIFIVPKIYRLNKYICEDRAFFFINVFSKDNISRGTFGFFNKKQKDFFLDNYRISHKKRYDVANFYGRYTKQYTAIIDNDEYNKKKDKAIRELLSDKSNRHNKNELELRNLKYRIYCMPQRLGITQAKFADALGIARRTIQDWRKMNDDCETAHIEQERGL